VGSAPSTGTAVTLPPTPVEADRLRADGLESRSFDGRGTESTRAKVAPVTPEFAAEGALDA